MFSWGSKDVKLVTFDVLVSGSRLWSLVGVERVFDLVEEFVIINYSESN